MQQLAPIDQDVRIDVSGLTAEGSAYDRIAIAKTTLRTYTIMWSAFCRWCDVIGEQALPAPPDLVAMYITDLARRIKCSSIHVHLAAIKHHHQERDLPSPTKDPTVQRRLNGIRRTKGMPPRRKRPLLLEDLDRSLDLAGPGIRGIRNRALFAVAWSAALRRSEVVGLDVGPGQGGTGFVTFVPQGIEITLVRSKTDQSGEGRVIVIPLRRRNREKCPVRLLQAWLDTADIVEGPVFRPIAQNGEIKPKRLLPVAVAKAVKTVAKRLDFDPKAFGGHSLRAGFVTSTIAAGAPVAAVQETTGHRQINTLFGYVRSTKRFEESALKEIPGW